MLPSAHIQCSTATCVFLGYNTFGCGSTGPKWFSSCLCITVFLSIGKVQENDEGGRKFDFFFLSHQ